MNIWNIRSSYINFLYVDKETKVDYIGIWQKLHFDNVEFMTSVSGAAVDYIFSIAVFTPSGVYDLEFLGY